MYDVLYDSQKFLKIIYGLVTLFRALAILVIEGYDNIFEVSNTMLDFFGWLRKQ